MSESLPIGWGFHPAPRDAFDRAAAGAREDVHRARQKNEQRLAREKAPRIYGSHIGRMHMRLALWLSGLPHVPPVNEVCEHMGNAHYETMRRLLIDYGAATGQGKPFHDSRNSSCVLHMRFALWASRLGRDATLAETQKRFAVAYQTARRLVADWKTLQQEMS